MTLSPTAALEDAKEIDSGEGSLEATDKFWFSEKDYVEKGLRRGFDIFVDRLEVHVEQNDVILKQDEINEIFGTYKVIQNANNDLLEQLLKVQMDRKMELRDELGKIMSKFIPFLKLYIDYIVKKQECMTSLNKLKKSNKKFAKFLLINEACARRKIKSFLDEPVARLPQYLQQMAAIYIAWEREDLGSSDFADSKKALFDAIAKIRQVTEEISEKVKNKKARRLLGILQKSLFNNKISLIASHRLVVHHGELHLLVSQSLELCHFILCNDILVVAKKKKMLHVLPLIGLKVEENPKISDKTKNKDNLPSFGIKAIDATQVRQFVLFAENDENRTNWIDIIEDAVDSEEHSLHPCNPVDLEKRLRKEKTSPEGVAETLTVTDPSIKQKIEEWKQNKNSPKKKKDKKKKQTGNLSSKTKPPPKAPPGRGGGTHGTAAPPNVNHGSGAKPPPKGGKPPPPHSSATSTGSGTGKPPPKKKGHGPPPPSGAPAPGPPNGSNGSGAVPKRKPMGVRGGLLAGIKGFDKSGGLKKVEEDGRKSSIARKGSVGRKKSIGGDSGDADEEPPDMGDLLVNTLANYRQYVMDDDDDEDDENDGWDD